ncbi:MAG: purine-binding chemotaxis protein CheW [Nitrospirae bacterium]|nr:purine-binding chemotaxis protein CheW [Nitrospirota bacterium]
MEGRVDQASRVEQAARHIIVFKADRREYGIEIERIREVLRMPAVTAIPHTPDFIAGVINVRGHLVAALDVRKRLQLPAGPPTAETRVMVTIINRMVAGLIVDAVVDVVDLHDMVIESPPAIIRSRLPCDFLSGVGRLGDRVIGLLRLDLLFTAEELSVPGRSGAQTREQPGEQK